ncbi:MAG TPA: hypothetical protein V6C69_17950 [Trichormus sp.]
MNLVDAFMSKFKKVDESERSRLRTARTSTPDKVESASDNTSLSPTKSRGTKPTSSITQLRAFVKKKSPEELKAEDAARLAANESFTEQALSDIKRDEY